MATEMTGYNANDALNRKLYDAVMHAAIAWEIGDRGLARRRLKYERAKAGGEFRRTLDRILALNDKKMTEFFDNVCKSYDI